MIFDEIDFSWRGDLISSDYTNFTLKNGSGTPEFIRQDQMLSGSRSGGQVRPMDSRKKLTDQIFESSLIFKNITFTLKLH